MQTQGNAAMHHERKPGQAHAWDRILRIMAWCVCPYSPYHDLLLVTAHLNRFGTFSRGRFQDLFRNQLAMVSLFCTSRMQEGFYWGERWDSMESGVTFFLDLRGKIVCLLLSQCTFEAASSEVTEGTHFKLNVRLLLGSCLPPDHG